MPARRRGQPVTARFRLTDAMLADILSQTADGNKYLPEFSVDITDEADEQVARCFKTLYIKRKSGVREKFPAPPERSSS